MAPVLTRSAMCWVRILVQGLERNVNVAKGPSGPNAVDAFLLGLARADRQVWSRASLALGSDLDAWRAAGERARRPILESGLAENSKELQLQAKILAQLYAALLERKERIHLAIWAAQGAVVGLLARPGLADEDVRHLCGPFADLIQVTAIRCRHGINPAWCSVCRDAVGPRVYVTGGGSHYHLKRSCPGLAAGQQLVEERGGSPANITAVGLTSDTLEDRTPCAVCRPPEKGASQFAPRQERARSRQSTSASRQHR